MAFPNGRFFRPFLSLPFRKSASYLALINIAINSSLHSEV